MSSGEVVVAGLVTGTHLIEDIGIAVPHQVAVRIPADVALRSKDLWRGIQQNRLFRLNAGSGLIFAADTSVPHPPPPIPPSPAVQQESQRLHHEVQRLQQENQQLRQEHQRLVVELTAERQRNDSLQAALVSGLQGVQTAIGKLESAPRVVMVGPGASSAGSPDVVGGDVPTFVPGKILPENVEAQIRPDKATAERSNVASAASRLRELKRGGG